MSIIIKLCSLKNSIIGYFYKWALDLGLLRVPQLGYTSCDVILSLTSYGRRVKDCIVYYTLVSLLRQKLQPKRIILWLSEEEWNDESLPKMILRLKEKGIEIKYCKDIRSYKKLIPTIQLYPNDCIMTVDDDIIYTNDTVDVVWQEHLKNPKSIICLNASVPLIEDGVPSHYIQWKELNAYSSGMALFPIGCGGTFYPFGSLHNDLIREELFMRLCPRADDIWFWFCGLLNNTDKIFVLKTHTDYSFDALYQYFHKGSALTHSNRLEHANDKQFRDLFEHYHAKINNKGKLEYHIC